MEALEQYFQEYYNTDAMDLSQQQIILQKINALHPEGVYQTRYRQAFNDWFRKNRKQQEELQKDDAEFQFRDWTEWKARYDRQMTKQDRWELLELMEDHAKEMWGAENKERLEDLKLLWEELPEGDLQVEKLPEKNLIEQIEEDTKSEVVGVEIPLEIEVEEMEEEKVVEEPKEETPEFQFADFYEQFGALSQEEQVSLLPTLESMIQTPLDKMKFLALQKKVLGTSNPAPVTMDVSVEEPTRIEESVPTEATIEAPEYVVVSTKPRAKMDVLDRFTQMDSNIDEITPRKTSNPDPSVLRNTSDPITRIKLYQESMEDGRMLYLPNSNYQVFVKKVRDKSKLSYLLTYLNGVKDVNITSSFIKNQLLKTVYEYVNFPDFTLRPSYQEFIQCLHESDMLVLMMMFALVNSTQTEDGKVPMEIGSFLCEKCDAIFYTEETITIDLKAEFKNIYPIEQFAYNLNVYQSRNYESIQEAYRDSDIGKLTLLQGEGDVCKYELLMSSPTMYKTQRLRDTYEETLYKIVGENIRDNAEMFDKLLDIEQVSQFMDFYSYQQFLHKQTELSEKDLQDSFADIEDEILRAQYVQQQEEEREQKKVIDRIVKLIQVAQQDYAGFFDVIDFIDEINVYTKEGDPIVEEINQQDVFAMVKILADLPSTLVSQIADYVDLARKKLQEVIHTDILFDEHDMSHVHFDFDGVYGTDEEALDRMMQNGATQERMDSMMEQRHKARQTILEEKKCLCGHQMWKLNYTTILFFSISNRLQGALV